ncbi:MAG: cell shape determination protein CcmA [Gammaproteobacteria bacterium RIFCSPLOWO2_02_FULL_47_50]|jgi:cytoskeletal protein CcmA (bactofilin family)|nr:MAG: cell shape determination protein CcmA [Gammaproteobacteria bacterium RIFCSPLOWO2_02_47_7]OGT66712.1 MAG: cell shape determination protein CcmA [Gammaproteobacteria bacterium RIFCSPLOWO2_01_FULL_47_190]OGT81131.1 MAG: cell shape determination protein CcmA [Gammaproteobacteria bacterium RIFCSPLOWO2_02_FULL_47_50]OGT87635.1 MAG: cell shape determination protein CcmA [Gammaproteobacteria bacterium RIFCSPLOWO2_12_FULL_47_76]
MWGKKRKQMTNRIDTLIGQHTEVTGDVKFAGGLHVDGTIKGNVYAENDGHSVLSLSEQGTIEGEVNVPYVKVNGVVIGDVHGSEHVELQSKARVTGNVYYNLIEMAIGAEVNGKLVHFPAGDDIPLALSHGEPVEVD